MKNKKFGKITAMLMAAAVLVLTAVPVYAAENIREVVKNREMVLEAGTDRVTYKVDTENGAAKDEAVAAPAGKETEIPGEAAGKEMQATGTAEAGESTEAEEAETDSGLTMTVTVSVEDILNYLLPEETEPVQTGTVKDCTMLNIRAGAGTENEVIGQLKAGDQVRVTGSDGKWYQITIPERADMCTANILT